MMNLSGSYGVISRHGYLVCNLGTQNTAYFLYNWDSQDCVNKVWPKQINH
jgi:hypothetical protein